MIVISVRPRWAEAIVTKRKWVEVRRRPMRVPPGIEVLIYATAPVSKIVGRCIVGSVQRGEASTMWSRFGNGTHLTRTEYDAYLACSSATCISVVEPRRLTPIPLSFPPPRSWAWLDPEKRDHRALIQAVRLQVGPKGSRGAYRNPYDEVCA